MWVPAGFLSMSKLSFQLLHLHILIQKFWNTNGYFQWRGMSLVQDVQWYIQKYWCLGFRRPLHLDLERGQVPPPTPLSSRWIKKLSKWATGNTFMSKLPLGKQNRTLVHSEVLKFFDIWNLSTQALNRHCTPQNGPHRGDYDTQILLSVLPEYEVLNWIKGK